MLFFINNARLRWAIFAVCFFGLIAFNFWAARYIGWSVDGRNIVSVLPHFFVGMVGCGLVVSLKSNNKKAICYLIGALACLIVSNWLYHRQPRWFWYAPGQVLVDFMILLFIFSHASLQPMRAASSRLNRSLL